MSEVLLTFSNPVFKNLAYYTSLVVVKMMAMSFVTAKYRLTKGVSGITFI